MKLKIFRTIAMGSLLAFGLVAGTSGAAFAAPATTAPLIQKAHIEASAEAADEDGQPDLRKPCDYMHGSQCVTWVTDYYSCKNIFQITDSTRKHAACTLFVTQGIVTVWP